MKFAAFIFASTLLLSGCTTIWVNPNKNQQEFYRDKSRCQAEAGQACGHGQYSGFCKKDVYDSCMYGGGWVKQE